MSQKKNKRFDQPSRRTPKKNSPVSSGHSNWKLLIGVAVVTVLVAGLIVTMVNKEASPTMTPSVGSRSIQQDGPKFTVTVNPPAASPTLGSAAPDFMLQDLRGRPVRLSKLRGKVVVLNFWATWCGPCRIEIPGFVKVYDKYRQKGLEIVGISLDQAGREVVEEFVKKNGIGYPVALDTSFQVAQQYGGVTGIPTTFIIDRQGRIAKWHVGYMDQTTFEATIVPLL